MKSDTKIEDKKPDPTKAEKGRRPSSCSVTHCVALVLLSPEDPTMICLRQVALRAKDKEEAINAAKEDAVAQNPGWHVQCATALYVAPNKELSD